MGHTLRDKHKLLNRVKRIRGQVEAIERALENECECIDVLQQITGCRGALTGLLAVVLEDHIRTHLTDIDGTSTGQPGDARDQLIDVVHSYFK